MAEPTKYPETVIAKSSKGITEVRRLLDRGRYVRYEYADPETGKKTENKVNLVLISGSGKEEEFFIIPIKGGRMLMLPVESRGKRMLWDGENAAEL